MDALSVHIQLKHIHCYDEGDGIGSAEPYLWAVFFKIDGDSASVDNTFTLRGTAKVYGTLGDHGNLNANDVDAGDDIAIPAQFGYGDTLTPIPLTVPVNGVTQVSGAIGCLIVLMEQDSTPDSAVAKGHAELNIAVQAALNDLIPTLNAGHLSPTDEEIQQMTDRVGSAVEDAIAQGTGVLDWIFAAGNMDDKIGSAVFDYSSSDLLAAGPAGIVLSERWHNEGDWQIDGEIKVAWSGWEDLGGPPGPVVVSTGTTALRAVRVVRPPVITSTQITSAPAVASWQENRLDCFARGIDTHMWHKWWDGAAWSPWEDLGGPPAPLVNTMRSARAGGVVGAFGEAQLASAPAAVSWGQNRIDTFGRGMDRHLWHKWWNGSAWSGWEDLGGSLASAPAVASWQENRLDCFVQGPNDHMWHKWWDGAAWSGWEDLGGILTAAPAAVSWGQNRIDCFARGTDNHMWHKWWDGAAWSGWEDLGGVLAAGPAVASRRENTLDCFVRGTNNHLFRKSWDGSAWSDWEDLGGTVTDSPAAISWGSDRIDCFVRGPSDHVWHIWWG
jgi:hypothetical protein